MTKKKFEIILAKNQLARGIKELYRSSNEPIPQMYYLAFEEVEKATGTGNQPTASDIFNSNHDI